MSMRKDKSSTKTSPEKSQSEPTTGVVELGVIKIPRVNLSLERITLPFEAPEKYLAAIAIIASIFLLAGGIYDLSENPIAIGGRGSRFLAVYPGLSVQFLVESIGVGILIAIGSLGFYFLRYSLYDPEDVQQSFAYLFTAILCITFALLILAGLMIFKLQGGNL